MVYKSLIKQKKNVGGNEIIINLVNFERVSLSPSNLKHADP